MGQRRWTTFSPFCTTCLRTRTSSGCPAMPSSYSPSLHRWVPHLVVSALFERRHRPLLLPFCSLARSLASEHTLHNLQHLHCWSPHRRSSRHCGRRRARRATKPSAVARRFGRSRSSRQMRWRMHLRCGGRRPACTWRCGTGSPSPRTPWRR